MKNLLFPPKLKKGAHIRIIAPASQIKKWSQVPKAINVLNQLGFRVSLGKHVKKTKGYLAGTDEQRLFDLHQAFSDKSVDAIVCLRGGYGCMRLLDKIDYGLIRKNPKVLCGFSDISALHLAIFTQAKVATFLGPNLLTFNRKNFKSSLTIKSFLSEVTPVEPNKK